MFKEFRVLSTKICKQQEKMTTNILRLVIKGIKHSNRLDQTLYTSFYYRRMAYKVLYVLTTYGKESGLKSINKRIAAHFLKTKLTTKAVKALGGRVQENRMHRADLVKRYWIDNSDEEADDARYTSKHVDL